MKFEVVPRRARDQHKIQSLISCRVNHKCTVCHTTLISARYELLLPVSNIEIWHKNVLVIMDFDPNDATAFPQERYLVAASTNDLFTLFQGHGQAHRRTLLPQPYDSLITTAKLVGNQAIVCGGNAIFVQRIDDRRPLSVNVRLGKQVNNQRDIGL
jgi:hypothetical protein